MTNKYLFTNNQLKTAIIYYIENNIESNNIWNQIKKNVDNPSFTTFLFYLYKLKEQNKYNIEIPKININANFYNKLIKILLDNQEKISDNFPLTNQSIIEIINNYDIQIKNLMKLLNQNNIVITLSKIKNTNKKNLIKVLYLKNKIQELKIDLFNLFSFFTSLFIACLTGFIFLFLLYIVVSIY
jgi:hypothetical protein